MSIDLNNKSEELLKAYRQEAIEALADEQNAKDRFTEVVETASEATGVAKAEIAAYYKAVFKEKIEALLERAEFWERLEKK